MNEKLTAVLAEVAAERARQDAKWGSDRTLPDGTGWLAQKARARRLRERCDQNFEQGNGTWADVLGEEAAEALAETDQEALRNELIQVAAVAVCWVQALDARKPE